MTGLRKFLAAWLAVLFCGAIATVMLVTARNFIYWDWVWFPSQWGTIFRVVLILVFAFIAAMVTNVMDEEDD